MEDCGDQEVEELQKDLNEIYDSFTAKYVCLAAMQTKGHLVRTVAIVF